VFLELDGQGPRHAQLTRAMKTAILGGRLAAGARLPPTRELAGELGLSRTTVLAAYEQLRAEGFIEGRVGSGSFVAELQMTPAAPPSAGEVAAPSRYTKRARETVPGLSPPADGELRYNLQYGTPLINPALTSAWSRELARAARYTDPHYPAVQGLRALREAVCDYLSRRRGVRADPDDLVIVNGTQQALSLSARVLLDEGDTVVLEEPAYFGARRVFAAHGARIVPVRTDGNGLVCAELPDTPPKLVFVTPSHQFPGGSLLSLSRRLELLRYASAKDCWILEDDYDGEFRYDVHPLAALRALDDNDRVIYIGTFSKSLLASLRLGYILVPRALRDDFVRAKWLCDFGSPGIDQAALANFIANGSFERNLRHAAKELKKRRAVLLDGLRKYGGKRIEVADSHAGMHVVVWLRDLDHAQCAALIERARTRGLGLHPIAPSYLGKPPGPGLLLGYAGIPATELAEAMRLFGQCLDEFR
jgi:GntR family transcriptional regulator/MocR family aminotransferase